MARLSKEKKLEKIEYKAGFVGYIHNIENIPKDWVKPQWWPENKTMGFITTKKGFKLFPVMNDYSYENMLRALAFRVDFLGERIEALELEKAKQNGLLNGKS